jgi:virulence-associated protein VapD
VYWAKPKNLSDIAKQKELIMAVLNDAYEHGGWTVFYDDVAHIARKLGFAKDIGTLFNQARSGHSSQVAAMTQPSSVTQSIPSEVWRQARFHLIFYYRTGRDLDAIADIVGYKPTQLKIWMRELRPFDFLCFDDLTDQVFLVRSGQ